MPLNEVGINAFYLVFIWVIFIGGIYLDAIRRDIARPRARAVLFGALGPGGALIYWMRHG